MPMGQENDGHTVKISLCLIVRDEAELLPQFLQHAAGLWDDLCVVDTGSRDDTRAILTAAGARIIDRAWDDDFSAARNAGLAAATGDWIVYLDADEMVSLEAVAALRAVAADPQAGAATIRMVNPLPHGHTQEARLLRAFRNDATIRFVHRIHEEVEPAVAAYLRRTGLQLRTLDAPVEHLGYVRERAAARGKRQRDTALLQRSIAEDAHDFYSHFKLLELARFWADPVLAREAAAACSAALVVAGPKALAGKVWGGDLIALMAQALYPADPARALKVLRRHERDVTTTAALLLRRGEWQELLGQAAHAADSFRAALTLAERTAEREQATVRPLMGLARLALARPQGIEEAWALTEQALAHNHRDPEALTCAASICRLAGGSALVAQFERDYTSRFGPTPELAQALAQPGARP
jgi:glycosyltransferase involved in cell wall biosynthesis